MGVLGLAPEIAVEILLGRKPGAPRGHAAGAIVDHAEHLGAGGIGGCLHKVMTCGGPSNLHLGRGTDTPGIFGIGNNCPIAAVALHLDNGAAMGHHLDVRQFLGHFLEVDFLHILFAGQAGEHQTLVGVFMIDAKQAVLARTINGEIADVIIVSRTMGLCLGGLISQVKIRIGQYRHPADQNVGLVAGTWWPHRRRPQFL
jgi:hypothetical protein